MNVVAPFHFVECARVFVHQANNARFVIKCNYCHDESSDWLEYAGHLHGDHDMPMDTDEAMNINQQKFDVYKTFDEHKICDANATASIQSTNAEYVLEPRQDGEGSGGMIEEHLDYECSSTEGGPNDGNYENSEGDLGEEFDLESDVDISSSQKTTASDGNSVKFSYPPSNKRFFQLRTTPINIMMQFIDILRENPLLWDTKHPDYSNKEKRKKNSFQFSQQIKRHFNINITARAASSSALALIRWFRRQYIRFVNCEVKNLKFVCYRSEYFEKLLQFVPLKRPQTISCNKCQKCFKSEHLLLSHKYKYHQGRAPFTCRFCERVFVHPSSLKLHENRHIKIDLWPCTECLYQSSSKADYLKHLASHSPAQPYKCDICGLAYKTSTNLSVHRRSHRLPEYECNICHKQFYEKYRYKRHLWQHHEDAVQHLGSSNSSLNAFNCNLCGRRFASHQTLLKHQVVHMLENYKLDGDETDLPQNVKNELQLHYCNHCSVEFINNAAYGAHMMLKHAIDIK